MPIDRPVLFPPRRAVADIDVLPSYFPAPGFGLVPINAFVIHATQPVLVDTGLAPLSDDFIEALEKVVPIASLRWLILTHADPDHVGSLRRLLDRVPALRIATSFLAMAKLSLTAPIPPDRFFLINPGQSLHVGDRSLLIVKPPTFDAPETFAVFDPSSRTLLSSDSFGALLPAPAETANAIAAGELRDGLTLWTTIDSPWLAISDKSAFEKTLDTIRTLAPQNVLGSHLPPATGMTDTLVSLLSNARTAPPFVGPDQPAFEQMMAQMAPPSEVPAPVTESPTPRGRGPAGAQPIR